MKRLFYILILYIVCTSTLQAQGVREAFVNMPDSILPILTKVNRADCIDFLDSNMKAEVKNRFDQPSEMTRLTKDYIAVQLSPQSRFEMKMLPVTDSTCVICTIRTVCSKACDSHIQFYANDWTPLALSDFIDLPSSTDFVPEALPSQVADTLSTPWETLCAEADILLMQATLYDTVPTLTFHYTTPQYMGKESAALIVPLLTRDRIQYEWKDGKFVRKED